MKVRFWRLTLKELRETLRDRRTVGTLVLMPMLVYPLLGIILQKFLLTQVGQYDSSEYIVCCDTTQELGRLRALYSRGNFLLRKAELKESGADPEHLSQQEEIDQILRSGQEEPILTFKVVEEYGVDYQQLLKDRQIDLYVQFTQLTDRQVSPGDFSEEPFDQQDQIEIVYVPGVSLSENALYHLQDRLQAVNQHFVTTFLDEHGNARIPVTATLAPMENQEAGPISIKTVIPLILILMTVTGAVYPAIDLTAGERERQTLETLISAPISRISLLQAKYIAVLTVAMLTALINLCSMMLTIFAIGVDKLIFADQPFSLLFVFQILGVLFVFASFFSSVLLSVTSFARSFKEAQAYLIPLMLLAIAPGVFCLLPGIKLTGALEWIPLINMVLLGRDLFTGTLDPQSALVVIVSTMFYTWIGLYVASRIFGTDAILYGSEGSWSDLWKSRQQEHDVPTFSSGLLCLAILFPTFMIASRILSRVVVDATETDAHAMFLRAMMSIGVTGALFAGLPLLLTPISHSRVVPTFAFHKAKWVWYAIGFLFAISLWPLVYEVNILIVSEEGLEKMKTYFSSFEEGLRNLHLGWKLLAYAIVPAVCEEIFFRGFLFSACRTSYSKWTTIFLTAFLFGLFHVLATADMMYVRFFPSFALGILIGLMRWHSGSLFPGMFFHVVHNGLLITVSSFPDEIAEYVDWAGEYREHLPLPLIIVSLIIALIAATWFIREQAKSRSGT